MAYEFFPQSVANSIPTLYSQEKAGDQAIVHAKFFTPDSDWTWFVLEYDPEQGLFFGLVCGQEKELGYFRLDELQTSKGPMGLAIERDIHWKPKTLAEIKAKKYVV